MQNGGRITVSGDQAQLSFTYGVTSGSDILYLNAAGRSIVILNSYEAAKDLLEGRSAIYSSRCVPLVARFAKSDKMCFEAYIGYAI